MNKEIIFQNVNINSINFINGKNDIKFEFLDSYKNSGNFCGELICIDILSLCMITDLEDDSFFPQFICDVTCEVDSKNIHKNIKFQGGSYDISIICKKTKITRPTMMV